MTNPLINLPLHYEGHLIIPTQEEITKACPVTLSDEQVREFASWRAEYPRLAAAAVGATEDGGISAEAAEAGSSGAGNAQGSAGGGGSATPPTLAPGTQADSEAAPDGKIWGRNSISTTSARKWCCCYP